MLWWNQKYFILLDWARWHAGQIWKLFWLTLLNSLSSVQKKELWQLQRKKEMLFSESSDNRWFWDGRNSFFWFLQRKNSWFQAVQGKRSHFAATCPHSCRFRISGYLKNSQKQPNAIQEKKELPAEWRGEGWEQRTLETTDKNWASLRKIENFSHSSGKIPQQKKKVWPQV